MKAIVCPISSQKIDENVSRLTALMTVLLLAAFVLTSNAYLLAFLVLDFMLRAGDYGRYSPLNRMVAAVVKRAHMKRKPVNKAQKIFAARLGFVFALAALLFYLGGFPLTSMILASILMILAFMDAVFKFCLGCLIYNYLVYPFYKNK